MLKLLLKKLSLLMPVRIYAGKSLTTTDTERSVDEKYTKKLNRRTAKAILKRRYSVYEISHIKAALDSHGKIYVLEHCYTGDKIEVNETVFHLMFDQI